MRNDVAVTGTVDASLDDLLAALDLQPSGDDRFVVASTGPPDGGRVLGGQLLAQAVRGAAASVADKDIHSLHACFVRAGTPGARVRVEVTRLRNGRSMATRQVAVLEGDEPLLVALASFGRFTPDPTVARRWPDPP